MRTSIGAFSVGETIHQTARSIVCRGERRSDGLPVVFKITRAEHPSMSELARLRHEYGILSRVDSKHVPRALGLEVLGNGLAIVQEEAGGRGLRGYIAGPPLTLEAFLRIAIAAAGAVEDIHRNEIIHKDIKPDHIVIDDTAQHARVVDFGIATSLSHEQQNPCGLDVMEGSLAYMSPEQTGRMNRVLDRRSDLYSLGVTLYEVLTQRLPFEARDPLELVHAHLAKVPVAPHLLRTDVPRPVSDILMKLLAKVAEERYQTAAGLRSDLERCLQALETSREIPPFLLGRREQQDRPRIPQKLYAREQARARLLAAFEDARAGHEQLFLVAGRAGSGKSALVHELRKELARAGRFASGKFDQLNRAVPYSAIAQACADLLGGLLTEPPDALSQWRARLLNALGHNGRVLAELVPDLELIIGRQPEVPQLGPSEAQNRFELVLQSFFDVFAGQQPLVLFLDDLQWAEPASLRLLELLVTRDRSSQLLVVGSYRDNELGRSHPLATFLKDVAGKPNVNQIEVGDLDLRDVRHVLEDTLGAREGGWHELAELMLRKTQGNPFFLAQFLDKIYAEGLLCFDSASAEWTCRLDAVAALVVTDNVVDLLIEKLGRLSPQTRGLLRLAACIGHEFDIRTLSVVSQLPLPEIAAALWQALKAEVLVPISGRYRYLQDYADGSELASEAPDIKCRFLHDRVQQAAYVTIPEAERGPIHLSIGRLLLAEASNETDETGLFELLGHLNLAGAQLEDPAERLAVAQLNVKGGRRARDAGAPSTAIDLLNHALRLLGDDPWQVDYDAAWDAHLILAECAYLEADAAQAGAALDLLDAHSKTVLERARSRNLRVLLLTSTGRLVEACQTSVDTLRALGLSLPPPSDPAALGAAIGAEFGAYQAALAGRDIETLADLPQMTDPLQLAIGTTLAGAVPAAYQSNQELLALIVLKAVQLTLRDGNAGFSPFFYCQYGIVHAVITGDQQASYRFGRLGLDLAERLGGECPAGPVHFIFAAFLSHWGAPFSVSLEHFELAVQKNLEQGDVMHATYSLTLGYIARLFSGQNLEVLQSELPAHLEATVRRKDVMNQLFSSVVNQGVRALRGETQRLDSLSDAGFDEASFAAAVPPPVLAVLRVVQASLQYLAGEYSAAFETADGALLFPGCSYHGEHRLYRALAAIRVAESDAARRDELLNKARADASCLEAWAAAAPTNYAHGAALIRAELSALTGDELDALTRFETAVDGAEASGLRHHHALASEQCGRFHLAKGRKVVGRAYLLNARHSYERWGATAKAQQLSLAHPELLQTASAAAEDARTTSSSTTATEVVGNLDIVSAMRATEAIAGELVLGKLIDRIMRLLLASAGAERGFLIVPSGDKLYIEATGSLDPEAIETGLHRELHADAPLATQIVRFVARRHESVVLADATSDQRFTTDPHVVAHRPKSVLAMALLHRGQLSAVVYLENNMGTKVFNPARVERIGFIAAHAAAALENAKLYSEVRLANENLEQKVLQRTTELRERNRDMRLVLDNVNQGLLTVDVRGRLAGERSSVVDEWLRSYEGNPLFAELCSELDPAFARSFEVGFQALIEDVMPLELCLDQLPRRMKSRQRELGLTYSPILSGNRVDGLLIIINDLTEELRRAREEAEQQDQLAVFQHLVNDRRGLGMFFSEAKQLMAALQGAQIDPATRKRMLHTLKGNAGQLGLQLFARQCHELEEALFEQRDTLASWTALQSRWHDIAQLMNAVLGERGEDVLEISQSIVREVADRLRHGAAAAAIAAELDAWRTEPVARPLARLAEHGQALATRLGRAQLTMEIESSGLHVGLDEASPLWAALVHLVRNAVDHGIEPSSERQRQGKSAGGLLRFTATLRGSQFVLAVQDDGRGIAWHQVEQLARQRGLAHESRADLIDALLSDEFSTRPDATDTSGRGVGMAAVHRAVRALGGQLDVESEPGRGCCWRLTIPASALRASRQHEAPSGSHQIDSRSVAV